MPRILIIGYGNTLRGDDGAGPVVAELLAREYDGNSQIAVIACHQLTPELAPAIAAVERLILIDAEADGRPGEIRCRELHPDAAGGDPLTHHITPGRLLTMAEILYGHAPRTTLHTVCGGSFDAGDGLTPAVEAAVPVLRAAVKDSLCSNTDRQRE
jgi:hydrogenase maturation protease